MGADRQEESVEEVLLLHREHSVHVGVGVVLQSKRLHNLHQLVSILSITMRSCTEQCQLGVKSDLELPQYAPVGLALVLNAGAWH